MEQTLALVDQDGKILSQLLDGERVEDKTSPEYYEEYIVSGPSVTTPDEHNVTGGAGCLKVGDGKWCFRQSTLSVTIPNLNWVFVGTPFVELVKDDRGSWAWNIVGSADRFTVTLNNPDRKEANILTGSRSIVVRLACKARHYPNR